MMFNFLGHGVVNAPIEDYIELSADEEVIALFNNIIYTQTSTDYPVIITKDFKNGSYYCNIRCAKSFYIK